MRDPCPCGAVVIVEIKHEGRHTEALFEKAFFLKGFFDIRSYLADHAHDVMLCFRISAMSLLDTNGGSQFRMPSYDSKLFILCNLKKKTLSLKCQNRASYEIRNWVTQGCESILHMIFSHLFPSALPQAPSHLPGGAGGQ